uniref:FYVE-type domain-containing protein n=1 Tax=Photinus pyralis TaxID=7054 RepID=A0A1Y1MZQ5_PHOPY
MLYNLKVTECMCCAQTTFSMFNRRHHCRRCGRVVCGTCSVKRMHVPTYENILVRVCLDCYDQAQQDGAGTSSSKSEASIRTLAVDWLLTDDTTHNEIVREEFSYEYAPSVSLCLSILKHHSKNEEYPKFLLDQCDAMLRLLQPMYSESLQEIDYLLVIKMLKSLAIAAKMLSAQCMLQWGSSLADRILSQADLLGLLAERDCLHLIPTTTPSQVRYIDANTLRRLRDKLLEREQWNLALEVSTKAGLDNAGVFAAWGKSYLKAGSLQRAREKFQRCFDKTAHYETSTELSNSYSSTQLPHYLSKVLHSSENRPIKNPPLLNEIIQILESYTTIIDPKIVKEVKMSNTLLSSTCSLNSSTTSVQNDMAVCILNKLRNLNNVMNGNYSAYSDTTESMSSVGKTKPYLEPLFYEECVYYLTKYGSHISVLEFYLKHSDYHQCLKYMLDHRLNSDYFIDVYMLCLKENCVSELHETMSEIDSTLDIWKDYLKHICRHLEKQSNLNSLYELQQFMGDFVRAALTCIKFYKDDAATFTELTGKVDYLHKAQQHLQQELEQEQWVEVASVRKPNMDSQDSFEAKGIANPSLVMKIDTRNVDKHINTISRQIEVAKFLADCEFSSAPVMQILPEILPFVTEDASFDSLHKTKIPTLFGSYYERVQLAVLAIVCGTNIEDGFGIAYRIITDHKLSAVKVYCQAGKQLAKSEKYNSIAQLVNCIRSSGVSDSAVTDMCDEMLILAVQTLTKTNVSGPQLDGLIKLITDRAAKISAYIESKQLKTAYLLAVKHKRMGDIRRILREAEFLNQPSIKTLCQKILHSHSHFPSHSKD